MPTRPPDQATGQLRTDSAGRTLTALMGARKALRFYPATNPLVRQALDRVERQLGEHVRDHGHLVLEVGKDQVSFQGRPLGDGDADLSRLAFKLHCLNVLELELTEGLDGAELQALLGVLNLPYDTLRELGSLDGTLASRGIRRVRVRYAETVVPTSVEQAGEGARRGWERMSRQPRHLVELLQDPAQFARELVRMCVEVVPAPGQRKLDAQLAFVDRLLTGAVAALEGEPAERRPELYEKLSIALEALVRSADPSGARMGGLPRVDLSHIDRTVLQVLPQRDLVKEISSKVKLHQGATTVMASALRQLRITASGEHRPNPVLQVIEAKQDSAQSVATNISVLDEIRIGEDVDGEYPGIVYAERDRNKNFSLATPRLAAGMSTEERRATQQLIEELADWRPAIDSIETVLDMLFNETNPNFLEAILKSLVDKLDEFLERGELGPALRILRGLNVERRNRRADSPSLARLEAALEQVERRENLDRLLQLAERLPGDSPILDDIKSFLFLLDKKVIHSIVDVVTDDPAFERRKRVLELTQFLCRNRLDLLAEGLRSSRPDVVRTIVWLLGHFGSDSLPHLRRAAIHPEARVRREAARALLALGSPEAMHILASLLGDRDEGVVTASLRGLNTRGTPECASTLDQVLREERFLERPEPLALLFVRVAGRLGGTSTAEALRRLEERGGIRFKLKTSPLREAVRAAVREIEERQGRR